MTLRVCLLGFGEVGQVLARDLRSRVAGLSAWDLHFADPGSAPSRAAAAIGVLAPNPGEAVAKAQLVISAVTAAQIGNAADSVTPHLAPDTWYFDMNSASPAAKAAAAQRVAEAGGRFVEAAIMSPIDPGGAASPLLIGGEHAAQFQPLAKELGFTQVRVMPGKLGSASAAKMCRSVLVKGLEALVLESLLSARRHGVDEVMLESLRGLKIDDWRQSAFYMASRALMHGARRAEEMREVARTVDEAGLQPHMSSACAAWQDWAGTHAEFRADDLPRLLDGLLAAHASRETA
jgi:3-hydroxyisobutyrate dehydrogenase-like beta-hydroxyacid dehydrogenase